MPQRDLEFGGRAGLDASLILCHGWRDERCALIVRLASVVRAFLCKANIVEAFPVACIRSCASSLFAAPAVNRRSILGPMQ